MSEKLKKSNPEAFQNILKRMLEAKGRGYWDPDDDVLERIQQQYADVEDDIELGSGGKCLSSSQAGLDGISDVFVGSPWGTTY